MARLGVAIVREYERGVVFRFGKIRKVREPGIRFMIPLADHMQKVSLRTVTMPIQSQQIITRDNVSIGVAAVAYYRRVDPGEVDRRDRERRVGDRPDRADDGPQRGGPLQPRSGAQRDRDAQRGDQGDPRHDERALGRAGPGRRAQGHRAPGDDEAGDGQRGRGGAGEAGEDHRGRRRGAQRRQAGRGGRRDRSITRSRCSSATSRCWARSRSSGTRPSSSRRSSSTASAP